MRAQQILNQAADTIEQRGQNGEVLLCVAVFIS